ncbi:hypothetical protein PVAP13_9NG815754 [Panicum virgatum]|uniref:Uncharacterized protein n=1 Tax=Panicum virgatum TaxID=38727 RepID=A0A8T0N103_PANVG|nr:hypothetical protein PVAP13_9NG815754 [Panicum virgatum]
MRAILSSARVDFLQPARANPNPHMPPPNSGCRATDSCPRRRSHITASPSSNRCLGDLESLPPRTSRVAALQSQLPPLSNRRCRPRIPPPDLIDEAENPIAAAARESLPTTPSDGSREGAR